MATFWLAWVCKDYLHKVLFVSLGAVETCLPCGLFVICSVIVRFTTGTQVLALLGWPSCVSCSEHMCMLCFGDECREALAVWGPHKSLSLALLSMLMLTSSVHWDLRIVLTRRWMQSRVRGWWRPLFFIRSVAAFSLSFTDCLAISLHTLAAKKKNSLTTQIN